MERGKIQRDFSKKWEDMTNEEKINFSNSKDPDKIEQSRGWYEYYRNKYLTFKSE
jgi:hypothetical protein